MHRVLEYLAPCAIPPPYGFTTAYRGIEFGEASETVTHTVNVANTGFLSDAYDMALGVPAWTTTLSLTRTPLLCPEASTAVSLTVTIPPGVTVGDRDQVTLTVTSVHSPVHAANVTVRTAIRVPAFLPLIVHE